MNRAERRRMMKKFPAYRKALKEATRETVKGLENMFKKQWEEDDEALNDGERNYEDDDDNDGDFYDD